MTRYVGADISLNHGAFLLMEDDKIIDYTYYTSIAGSADKSKRGFRLPPPPSKDKDRQRYAMERLAWLENFIDKQVLMPWMPEYIGIEDYAIRAEQGAHYLGEIGGIARILCWFRGIKLRLHDPISVKMFCTWDGTAQKDLVEARVLSRWGLDFGKYNGDPAKPTAKNPKPRPNRTTSEDMADAYTIAKLVWTEVQLRQGTLSMKELAHDKERQVFQRVTKTYPTNLLDREWIWNQKGTATPHGEPVCPECKSRDCCKAKDVEKETERLKRIIKPLKGSK